MSARTWNWLHPAGTAVVVALGNGDLIETSTTGPAIVCAGEACVQVAGIGGFVPLSSLQISRPDAVPESSPQR